MYAIMLVFATSGVAMPALQSIVSRHVPSNEQGELQGSLMSLGSLAAVIAPAIYTGLFVRFTRVGDGLYFPGAAYAGAAAICLVALALNLLSTRQRVVKSQ